MIENEDDNKNKTATDGEGQKRKKHKTSTVDQANGEAGSSKKQKKSDLRPLDPPVQSSTIPPFSSSSHPRQIVMDQDELDSDEADIFEIDELLPSSPVHYHDNHSPPAPSTSQIISQATPTPKPTKHTKKKKRISDSSGFDTPSAPSHLRQPLVLHSTPGTAGLGLGLGSKNKGTPVVPKALVRLGASWVTSTPVPK